jgi:hypothetical protein
VLSLREAREVNVRNNGDSMSVCLYVCQFAFINLQILTNFRTVFRIKAMINLQGKKFTTSLEPDGVLSCSLELATGSLA